MYRARFLPLALSSMHEAHGPSWHSLASEATQVQAIWIIVLVRKWIVSMSGAEPR
jgi:hypothetical protein